MPTCVYCVETKPATAFTAEHVLPKSFGGFRDGLVLHEIVCGECNQYFSGELELYLARDTPDGVNRYLIGGKDPADFKSLGKRSTLVHRADSGPLTGALVVQGVKDGKLAVTPLPQIGFGTAPTGPFKWFTIDDLPTREVLRALVEEGRVHIHLCEIHDPESVLAALRERGLQQSGDIVETRPAGWQSTERIETRGTLGMPFGRAITKIAFNYLAHEYGASTALMTQFNTARRFARHGGRPDERRIWTMEEQGPSDAQPLGHRLALECDPRERTVSATLSFHHIAYTYRVLLGADFNIAPVGERAHFFDIKTMTARRVR